MFTIYELNGIYGIGWSGTAQICQIWDNNCCAAGKINLRRTWDYGVWTLKDLHGGYNELFNRDMLFGYLVVCVVRWLDREVDFNNCANIFFLTKTIQHKSLETFSNYSCQQLRGPSSKNSEKIPQIDTTIIVARQLIDLLLKFPCCHSMLDF